MRNLYRRAVILGGCLCAAVMMTGCAYHIAHYDVSVRIDDKMADAKGVIPSVETHLIALSPIDGMQLDRVPMGVYWDPNRSRREDYNRVICQFGGEHTNQYTLRYKDPIWGLWDTARATDLYVLSDLPGVFQIRPGMEDPRRVRIPLRRSLWPWCPFSSLRKLSIQIDQGGILWWDPDRPETLRRASMAPARDNPSVPTWVTPQQPTVPTIPQPTVPTVQPPTVPTIPQPTLPQPTVPAIPQPTVPTLPQPTIPSPTIPQPTLPQPTIPSPTIPAPTLPPPTLPQPTVPTR